MEPVDKTLRVAVGADPDGTPVIALAGELDLTGAEEAERAFAEVAPTPGGDAAVVVDMSELTFMDSAGLTVLLLAVRRGQAVRLRRPTRTIGQLIEATGLQTILPIEP